MEVRPRHSKDLEWLQERVAKERDARQRDRCRIVLLALQGHTAVQIGEKVGCSRRTVQHWVYRYRDQGLEGLRERLREIWSNVDGAAKSRSAPHGMVLSASNPRPRVAKRGIRELVFPFLPPRQMLWIGS